jgi:tRNA threonylcarbamoyladenosine biosynthesis protein TsaB
MLILATDTSGKYGSIALARCEPETVRALEVVPLQCGTFSAQLVPQISGLLQKHNLQKNDIDAFAVVSGPGSFTGLRVGLATIKALAEILHKPIAAMSLLEVIAFEITKSVRDPRVMIAMDAGRNEAFVGEYAISRGLPVRLGESLLTFGEVGDRALDYPGTYTTDESVLHALALHDHGLTPRNLIRVNRPNALSVTQLGYKKILAGQTITPEALDATYIRRADAEIKNPSQKPA